MKKIFVILLLTVSLNSFSQTQVPSLHDSTIRTSDSIPTISVNDLLTVITFYYDKNMLTPKEYDLLRSFKDVVINYTEPRRKVKVKKK